MRDVARGSSGLGEETDIWKPCENTTAPAFVHCNKYIFRHLLCAMSMARSLGYTGS